jgi:hypothetical protein
MGSYTVAISSVTKADLMTISLFDKGEASREMSLVVNVCDRSEGLNERALSRLGPEGWKL